MEIGFLIKIISDNLKKDANSKLEKLGLTLSQAVILSFLSRQPDYTSTQKEIEVFLDIAHPTVTGLITRLEDKQLVESEITVNRRFSKTVKITPKGLEYTKNSEKDRTQQEENILKNLTGGERKTLEALLLKVKDALDKK